MIPWLFYQTRKFFPVEKRYKVDKICMIYSAISMILTLIVLFILTRRTFFETPQKWDKDVTWGIGVERGLHKLLTLVKNVTKENNIDIWPMDDSLYSSIFFELIVLV